jgi:hypothetical protein
MGRDCVSERRSNRKESYSERTRGLRAMLARPCARNTKACRATTPTFLRHPPNQR